MFLRLREMIRQRRNREGLYSTAAYWDYKANTLAGDAVSMWPNNALNPLYDQEQTAIIERYVGRVQGLDLLDLGCGTGRFSRMFTAQGARTTGVDFAASALAIAQSQSSGGNPTYRQCSVFELAEENAYDVVFTWGVLTIACRDRDQLLDGLKRIRRALRSNGRLLLTEPIHRGFLHRVLNMGRADFLAVMREAGFDIKATTPVHFWPMRLALAYIPWPAWITVPLFHAGQAAMKLPGLSTLGDYLAILAYPVETAGSNTSVAAGDGRH